LEDAKLDYRNATEQNRELQRRLSEVMMMMKKQEKALNGNNYVLVLIDGDGMIFKNIEEGRAGGKKSAERLYKLVYDSTGYIPIIRVFANVEGLSRNLKFAGLIPSGNVFRDFTVGFTDPVREHVDFIDVGEGKELADEKIKSELKWHIDNYNCRSIILGVSHDNGYARVLDLIATDHREMMNKIVLLEGPPFARELEALPFEKIKYADVFNPEKFDAYQIPRSAPAVGPPPGLLPSQMKVYNPIAPPSSYAAAVNTTPPSPPSSKSSPALQKATPVFSETAIKDAVRRIKSLQPKPCNNHYLKGECTWDECRFKHDYKLKPDELQAMKKLAGLKPCNYGKDCINEKCYYNHDVDPEEE